MSEQTQSPQSAAAEEQVKAALRSVYDPELGLNIVELGLVRKIECLPDMTEVTMLLTTPFCPYGPHLIEQARQAIERATNKPARVILGTEMWQPSMMENGGPANWGLF